MIFTTNFEKDHGNPRQAAGTVDGICLEQNDKSVLTIPWAMKIDNTFYCFHGKSTFLTKEVVMIYIMMI